MRDCLITFATMIVAPLCFAGPPSVVNVPGDQPTIQGGIDAVANGGEVIVAAGVYNEAIDFVGKALTLRSTDPTDPAIVAATIIDGAESGDSVVRCVGGEGPETVLSGFTITGGSDPLAGGGMRNVGSSPTVMHCLFLDNSVGSEGGGMYNESSNPLVIACTFSGNTSLSGGGMYNRESSPQVVDCIFIQNRALRIFDLFGAGGGMFNMCSDPTLINVAFIGNEAEGGGFGGGGGMYSRDSSPAVINCTFVQNAGEPFGDTGGIFNRDASNPALTNCIVWGNTPLEITDLFGASTTVTYSDVQGGWPGAGNLDGDPLFVDPSGPDGLAGTLLDNDYRLSGRSPCIDAGDNTAVPGDITTDLDGNPRFVDDPSTADTGVGDPPVVDMGAYERSAGCPSDFDRSGAVDVTDLVILIGAWGGDGSTGGDVDDDGDVDVADLIALLAAWGTC